MKMAVVWTPGDWNAMISDAIELKNAHTHSSFFNKEERVVNICGLFMCHPTNSRSPSVHISSLIALEWLQIKSQCYYHAACIIINDEKVVGVWLLLWNKGSLQLLLLHIFTWPCVSAFVASKTWWAKSVSIHKELCLIAVIVWSSCACNCNQTYQLVFTDIYYFIVPSFCAAPCRFWANHSSSHKWSIRINNRCVESDDIFNFRCWKMLREEISNQVMHKNVNLNTKGHASY